MLFQNQVLIEGFLVENPELKETKNGTPFTNFSICFNKSKRKNETEWETIPNYFHIKAWKKTAELSAKYKKGDALSICGSLCYSSFTDQNNNKKAYTFILASSVKKIEIIKQSQTETTIENEEVTIENEELSDEERKSFDIF